MRIVTELIPKWGQISFYGKAKQIETEKEYILASYGTEVCSIDKETHNFHRLWCGWSLTTQNHINSFRWTHNMDGINKKQWEAMNTEYQSEIERR